LASKSKPEFTQWLKGRQLARMTPLTTTDLKAFRQMVEQVRQQDFCLASEEHELGVHALAIPLRNSQGQTLAALNVVAAPARLSMAQMQRDLLPLLLETAAELRPLL
jgi:IclR family pca regulon transcriptional regulator